MPIECDSTFDLEWRKALSSDSTFDLKQNALSSDSTFDLEQRKMLPSVARISTWNNRKRSQV